ncbi:MAG TPA: M28 family peptidase [Acidobacteriaceae bacterium]|nr:M28 family peptidase [Acidobacteriaceae bacterium]
MTARPFVLAGKALLVAAAVLFLPSAFAQASKSLPQFDGAKALAYTSSFVASGPRWVGSPGHAKAQAYLERQFAKDDLEKDTFTASTPAGTMQMTNLIVKFPGKKDGIIVLASHYDTNYPLKDTSYVGANDGGSSTGLLLQLANSFRGRKLDGYSVWLVFFDGEEAIRTWTDSDSAYGSKHLAAVWQKDGTLKRIKAFLLADMIGDQDLDILRDTSSTAWLLNLVGDAATKYGDQSYFFAQEGPVGDDHTAFVQRGVPCADLIDFDYGYDNSFWHTPQDTMDKLSAKSLTIVGDVFLETIALLNQR